MARGLRWERIDRDHDEHSDLVLVDSSAGGKFIGDCPERTSLHLTLSREERLIVPQLCSTRLQKTSSPGVLRLPTSSRSARFFSRVLPLERRLPRSRADQPGSPPGKVDAMNYAQPSTQRTTHHIGMPF